nr:tetratricopeptide repeat protein [Kibdelosporangium sp. MJ126-NF4]CEL17024.1 transcriptional regulator, SARP family [Kibdelosporangium sp. MJ126-NF4]CTQ91746.1 transcriptional regulator, SARP family [Kibdelosporangium sp. MJ126-NF4]
MAAVHRTILVVDVVGFGDIRRTNAHQLEVRRGLYGAVESACTAAGIPWDDCHREDRGDGIMIVVPAHVPKSLFAEALPGHLTAALRTHNQVHPPQARIRLRMALHAGEVHHDDHGVVGRAVNLAFRLLDCGTFRAMHTRSDVPLAIIASAWFFDEVIWHGPAAAEYQRFRVSAKEVDTVAWINLPGADVRQEPASAERPVPRQLPVDTYQFAGRTGEIDRLDGLADGSTVIITAIDGSAGIGKTTLATHWAHRAKDQFPDGQLYVNLRGFDLREPMRADQALHGFLLALGVAPQGLPADVETKAALFRSLMADRRTLVVLDNARSADQVRPLLPGSPGSMVLITSRNRLDSLVVREGARRVALDGMSAAESRALLARRVPQEVLAADPPATDELIELCAGLPLALSIAAARVTGPIAELVREIRQERHRLDALDLGDTDLSVRAVFSWSYEVLAAPAARLFRMLGLHPGPSIDVYACCAITGAGRAATRAILNELRRLNLISEDDGRFRFHDLLRAYAHELAEDDPEREAVARRLLVYYVGAALLTTRLILPHQDVPFTAPDRPEALPPLTTYADGMGWFAAEHSTLRAMVTFAADQGSADLCWQLAWACTVFLRRTGRREERAAMHRTAYAAAKRQGDVVGQIYSGKFLAVALARLGRVDEGLEQLNEAMSLVGSSPELSEEHQLHYSYAKLYEAKGDPATALTHARLEWELASRTGAPMRRAGALLIVGHQLCLLGRYAEALTLCEQTLAAYVAHDNLEGEADVLMTIGDCERGLGRHHDAIAHYARAIALDRVLGDIYWEAIGLEHLAEARAHVGAADRGESEMRQSLEILDQLRHPDAERLRRKLSVVRTQ